MQDHIYVLRLGKAPFKYYVGRSSNFRQRIQEHFGPEGNEWVKPLLKDGVDVVHYFRMRDAFDEDFTAIRLMLEHGMDNVRGGSNAFETFYSFRGMSIGAILASAADKCFRCGKNERGCRKEVCSNKSSRWSSFRLRSRRDVKAAANYSFNPPEHDAPEEARAILRAFLGDDDDDETVDSEDSEPSQPADASDDALLDDFQEILKIDEKE